MRDSDAVGLPDYGRSRVITTGSMRLPSTTGDVRGKMQHPARTKGIESSSDPARGHLRAVQEHLGNADIQPDDNLQTARAAGSNMS